MRWIAQWWRVALVFLLLAPSRGLTLEDLRKEANLTPKKFASYFSGFKYEYNEEVQPPEQFLATRTGDCDDYATLAALVLGEKGYHPHLVTVRMPGLVHVICYIEETKGYLDFNARDYLIHIVSCKSGLADIARQVARSFDANWTTASEFLFEEGLKQMLQTTVETSRQNPALIGKQARPPRIKMDF
jgi:hypothetical protein